MNYELKIIPNTKIAIYCWSGEITLKDREDSRHHVMQFCPPMLGNEKTGAIVLQLPRELSEVDGRVPSIVGDGAGDGASLCEARHALAVCAILDGQQCSVAR